MRHFISMGLLGVVLLTPAVIAPNRASAQDKPVRYEDRDHHDWHEFNEAEERAYRKWREEQHKSYVEFHKLKAKEQQAYWRWRHDHPDA